MKKRLGVMIFLAVFILSSVSNVLGSEVDLLTAEQKAKIPKALVIDKPIKKLYTRRNKVFMYRRAYGAV